MKLDIHADGNRVLVCLEEDMGCSSCGNKENHDSWYYCEQDRKVYCIDCYYDKKACRTHSNHIDWKIDEVKIIEKEKDTKPQHRMNKDLLIEQGVELE